MKRTPVVTIILSSLFLIFAFQNCGQSIRSNMDPSLMNQSSSISPESSNCPSEFIISGPQDVVLGPSTPPHTYRIDPVHSCMAPIADVSDIDWKVEGVSVSTSNPASISFSPTGLPRVYSVTASFKDDKGTSHLLSHTVFATEDISAIKAAISGSPVRTHVGTVADIEFYVKGNSSVKQISANLNLPSGFVVTKAESSNASLLSCTGGTISAQSTEPLPDAVGTCKFTIQTPVVPVANYDIGLSAGTCDNPTRCEYLPGKIELAEIVYARYMGYGTFPMPGSIVNIRFFLQGNNVVKTMSVEYNFPAGVTVLSAASSTTQLNCTTTGMSWASTGAPIPYSTTNQVAGHCSVTVLLPDSITVGMHQLVVTQKTCDGLCQTSNSVINVTAPTEKLVQIAGSNTSAKPGDTFDVEFSLMGNGTSKTFGGFIVLPADFSIVSATSSNPSLRCNTDATIQYSSTSVIPAEGSRCKYTIKAAEHAKEGDGYITAVCSPFFGSPCESRPAKVSIRSSLN